MFRIIIAFVALFIAVWVGIKVHAHPGYLLIAYGGWSVETTLWFAIIAILIFFLAVYLLAKLFDWLLSISGRLHNWASKRRMNKAQQLTNQGICELAEGDWKQAEKHLLKGAITKQVALINFLAAAHAAQGQQAYDKRDEYLRKAHLANPVAEMAIGLTQARLQLEANQLEQALTTLIYLHEQKPNHAYVLSLLRKVYLHLQDWESVRDLLPALKKHKALSAEEIKNVEQQLYAQLLAKAIKTNKAVEKTWQAMPKKFHQDKNILMEYTNYLIAQNQAEKAEPLLYNAIKKSWDQDFVYQYSNTRMDKPAKQLARAEHWMKNHPDDSVLLFTLSKLCVNYQLWGKARDYCEKSLSLDPKPKTQQLLDEIMKSI